MGLQVPSGRGQRACWALSLYPEAGEAGGCFVSSTRPRTGGYYATPGADQERARQEAARRARGKVRRYCAANGLNRLGTLTYRGEGCHDERVLRSHVGEFFRAVRDGLGGDPLPYLWVPEWHSGGHGLHVHFGVGRFVRRSLIETAWGRGFVHIKLLGDLPVGSGPRGEARRVAGYLSKYVVKTFDTARPGRLHRYEIAQGFQPRAVALYDTSADGLLSQASQLMGGAPARSWSSDQVEDWKAPPAVWFGWD